MQRSRRYDGERKVKKNPVTPALLYRPRPLEQEGLNGYLLRLAEGNGLRGVVQLWPDRTRSLDLLCLRLGIRSDPASYEKLARLAPQLTVEKSQHPVWNHHHSRFCATCLSESPVWKLEWELTLSTACPKHRLGSPTNAVNAGHRKNGADSFLHIASVAPPYQLRLRDKPTNLKCTLPR